MIKEWRFMSENASTCPEVVVCKLAWNIPRFPRSFEVRLSFLWSSKWLPSSTNRMQCRRSRWFLNYYLFKEIFCNTRAWSFREAGHIRILVKLYCCCLIPRLMTNKEYQLYYLTWDNPVGLLDHIQLQLKESSICRNHLCRCNWDLANEDNSSLSKLRDMNSTTNSLILVYNFKISV